jgi:PAS domain S-box-containing protein
MFVLTNISVVLLATTFVNFIVTVLSWQRKKDRNGVYFSFGMMGVTFWTLAAGLDYAAISIPLKVFFTKFEYIGYNTALFFFAVFALLYAGYGEWLKLIPVRLFLYFLPLSNILLAWTNDWSEWLWSGFTRSEFGDNTVIFEHGPGFFWTVISGYLLILIILVPLWQLAHRGPEFSRKQARLLFLSSLIPVVANLLYLFQPKEFRGADWSSITFSISGFMFLMALYGARFLDLVPIARDKLVAGISDGMIVLDMQGRIIDINHAAASMIQSSPEKLIGKTLVEVVPLIESLPELISEQEIRTELAFGDAVKRHFDVLISALQDERKKIIGRLIVFRDITERKQAEQALEQRFLEIQQLHKNLQETQSQLVNQQRALAAMEERQRLARDLHDSVNQSIHGMVLFTDTLAATLEKNNMERARHIMDRLRESANQSLRETRLMLYELQGSGPERSVDLVRDLKDRLAMVESRVGVRTRLIQEGSLESCPPEWYENLFWIAVEALNNSLKHAQARSVQIVIRCSDHRVELEVIDDGKGFDLHKVETGGLGLKNLRARADIIGGTLVVESEPSKGTTVRFSAEIKAKQNE